MATSAILCIGCDDYDYLSPLHGAVSDCGRVFDQLGADPLYSNGKRLKLESPTSIEVRAALAELLDQKEMGALTIYFAGHAGMKLGTFYLCTKDSDQEKLSATALPISHFYTVVGELRPRQVNFVIDACQSGGAVLDITALTKQETVGNADTSSIAFLAACAADQYATEAQGGGVATTALMRYLTGEREVQASRPYLDLVEVGLAVSRDVHGDSSDQTPTAWGLNLYGEGQFASNPHFTTSDEARSVPVGFPPMSEAGEAVRKHADALWNEFRLIKADHDPVRLASVLRQVRLDLKDHYPAFVGGFIPALAARGAKSVDLLAAADALSVGSASLISDAGASPASEIIGEIVSRQLTATKDGATELHEALKRSRYALLARQNTFADFHLLPMRISRTLAWVALGRLSAETLGDGDSNFVETTDVLVTQISEIYAPSLIGVSDTQAAWLHIFLSLAPRFGWFNHGRHALDRILASVLKVQGMVLSDAVRGEDAFRYTLLRAGQLAPFEYEKFANPSELLSVLLLHANRFGLAEALDKAMAVLDGRSTNTYVPSDYSHFFESHIDGGNNFVLRIGHDYWTVDQFLTAMKRPLEQARQAAEGLDPVRQLACCQAALVLPDRTPLFLPL